MLSVKSFWSKPYFPRASLTSARIVHLARRAADCSFLPSLLRRQVSQEQSRSYVRSYLRNLLIIYQSFANETKPLLRADTRMRKKKTCKLYDEYYKWKLINEYEWTNLKMCFFFIHYLLSHIKKTVVYSLVESLSEIKYVTWDYAGLSLTCHCLRIPLRLRW